jgi:pimeloyl-ACP methyl ester carboxylesterase
MPTVTVDQVPIHYREQGRGDALVLLHGFPLDGRVLEPLLAPLAKHCRVIVPDLLGFGQSRCDQPFTMASQAMVVRDLLEQLKIDRCVLGGLSMGGYVAFAFARLYPALLRGLILIDTRANADNADAKQNRNKMAELVRREGTAAVAEMMFPKMLADARGERSPEAARLLQQVMAECPPQTIAHACLAMRDRDDATTLLPSIAVPVLAIFGQHDVISPVSCGQEMASLAPRGRLAVIDDAGHMAPMEQPAKVAEAITSFLREL